MKRMIASAGLLALGAASVHAAGYAPGYASADNSKPWSVSATLRGFYDDNIYTAPTDVPGVQGPVSSWGVSITPTISGALSTDQTEFGGRFTFMGNYYDARTSDKWDNSYLFDVYLGHTFSSRVNMYIADSAAYSSEPDVIAPISAGGQPFRTDNNNFRNTGSITLNAQITELMTLVLGYSNNYYDYQQQGVGSYSALLDRIENLGLVNLRYQLSPVTDVLVGANFGVINYTGDEIIGFSSTTGTPIYSDSRNQNQFTIYAGADHSFTPDFSTSIRAGAQYANVYNANPDYTIWNPWADLSVQYQYGEGCYVRGGFRQFFDQTYVLAANSSASVVYAAVNHAFTPKLTGGIIGTFQYSEYNSPANAVQTYGAVNGTSANFFELGLNMAYQIDRHFSVNASYLLDLNDSSTPSVYSYTRNRIFFGVGATY